MIRNYSSGQLKKISSLQRQRTAPYMALFLAVWQIALVTTISQVEERERERERVERL